MLKLSSIFIFLIKIYQKCISPFAPGCCRFIPTCSNYAMSAIKKHGAVKGLWLSCLRIGKCHPLGGKGYDPIP